MLEKYVGRYDFSANDWITVTRVGDQLFIGGSGYPKVRFYPESEVAFFSKSFNEQIIFTVNSAGRATEALDIGSAESKRYKRVR